MFEEDFENLNEDEEEQLKDRFAQLEERLNQLELETGEGHHALNNQKRLMYYLDELCRILESELDVDLPDPPSLEE